MKLTVLPERLRYVVVEGPIGAGKTSLARRLAEVSGSTLLLEDPGANPFLMLPPECGAGWPRGTSRECRLSRRCRV